jgi:hypothetical protein
MDFNAIREHLLTLLSDVTEISFAYKHRASNIEGYPAIIFDLTSVDNEMYTNTENRRTAIFTIYIIQEVQNTGGIENANEYLDDASVAVINALEARENLTLSGLVDYIEPALGAREEQATATGATLWQEVKLKCVSLASTV